MTSNAPLVRLTGALTSLLLAGSASADIIVSTLTPQVAVAVATRVDNEMAHDELATGGTLLFGRSSASPLGASAVVKEGEPWSHPCTVAHCAALSSQSAFAKGEINADLGRFKALTSVGLTSAGGAAQTLLRQNDVVTFDVRSFIKTPQLKLHIDLDSSAGDSTETRGYSLFEFSVSLNRKACDTDLAPDGCDNSLFHFHGQDYAGTDLDSWYFTGQDGDRLGEGTRLPNGGLDITLDMFDLGGAAVQINTEYDLRIYSRSYSECAARSDAAPETHCSTDLDASHTAYVGITNLATSTYRYPGMTASGPGNNVPEPASLALVSTALGLVALGARRGRRRGG